MFGRVPFLRFLRGAFALTVESATGLTQNRRIGLPSGPPIPGQIVRVANSQGDWEYGDADGGLLLLSSPPADESIECWYDLRYGWTWCRKTIGGTNYWISSFQYVEFDSWKGNSSGSLTSFKSNSFALPYGDILVSRFSLSYTFESDWTPSNQGYFGIQGSQFVLLKSFNGESFSHQDVDFESFPNVIVSPQGQVAIVMGGCDGTINLQYYLYYNYLLPA